jgi:polar amino acid transport system ATP-binding protein
LTPAVEVRGLVKRFGPLTVLDGVDLTVAAGQVLCVIGPSGSGKSTLLRCINALEKPEEGLIFVNGQCVGWRREGDELRQETPAELARHRAAIGMVFQSFNLFPHMTAIQNVAIGPQVVLKRDKHQVLEAAREALRSVGLAGKENNYPRQLSGGQQQRVAIARALAMEPSVMLFDEPTSALDPELVGEVLGVMANLAEQGMTMLVATHEMQFAREVADAIAVFDRGKIIEHGPPSQVMDAPRHERTASFLARVTPQFQKAGGSPAASP